MIGYDLAGQLSSLQAGPGVSTTPSLQQYYPAYDCAANRTSLYQSNGQLGLLSGSPGNNDTITITIFDPALSSGQEIVATYTVVGTPTTASVAADLAALITSGTNLQNAGINATSSGSVLNLKSKTGNVSTYSANIVLSSGSETLSFGANTSIENITIAVRHLTTTR